MNEFERINKLAEAACVFLRKVCSHPYIKSNFMLVKEIDYLATQIKGLSSKFIDIELKKISNLSEVIQKSLINLTKEISAIAKNLPEKERPHLIFWWEQAVISWNKITEGIRNYFISPPGWEEEAKQILKIKKEKSVNFLKV